MYVFVCFCAIGCHLCVEHKYSGIGYFIFKCETTENVFFYMNLKKDFKTSDLCKGLRWVVAFVAKGNIVFVESCI